MARLKQQWTFDYHDYNDNDPAYREEFRKFQQAYEANQDSYVNIDFDWVGEEDELKDFPLLVTAMKDAGITSCIVLIWW